MNEIVIMMEVKQKAKNKRINIMKNQKNLNE